MQDKKQIAQQLLEVVPLVMRVVAAELRRVMPELQPPHVAALYILSRQPCNLSQLAELHVVSLPTMSNTVSKLTKMGLVQRTRALHDRRMVLLSLTTEGEALLQQIGEMVVHHISQLLDPLSGEELVALHNGLNVLQSIFFPIINISGERKE